LGLRCRSRPQPAPGADGGFFEAPDIAKFLEHRAAAHTRLTCPPNAHLTLVDISGMQIQSQDSVEGFRHLLADQSFHARRLAFVMTSSLIRGQIARAIETRAVRFFGDTESAETWLLAEPESSAA
jgi:hypothetical protein